MSERWKIKRTITYLESDMTLVDDVEYQDIGPKNGFESQKDALKYIVEHDYFIVGIDVKEKIIWLAPISKRRRY